MEQVPPRQNVCALCRCADYPDCEFGGEACPTCIGDDGSHTTGGNNDDDALSVEMEEPVRCSLCDENKTPDEMVEWQSQDLTTSATVCLACLSASCEACGALPAQCGCAGEAADPTEGTPSHDGEEDEDNTYYDPDMM